MQFKFSTDSEVGTIEAEDFDAACDKLQAMITPEAESDGAWGWVEDHDGDRFWIGGNN